MSACAEVTLNLEGGARLRLHLLPGKDPSSKPAPLLAPGEDGVIGVLEGGEYVFVVEGAKRVRVERQEVWHADDASGLTGRLRPGLFVGTLPLALEVDGEWCELVLEVRSRKLAYRTQYRWMLRDLIAAFAEVVMRSFAVSGQPFVAEGPGSTGVLYPRFAYLDALIGSGALEAAIGQVLARPHTEWAEQEEPRRPGQGIRAGADVARQLQRRGARTLAPGMPSGTLPRTLHERRPEETFDTAPNRYVRALLERSRELVDAVEAEPGSDRASASRLCARVRRQLDRWLSAPLFAEVSRGGAEAARHNNQVLQKRAGYRELFEVGERMELASRLAWPGGEGVFRAGVRDVAQLYEFWCYLELASALSELCAEPLRLDALVEPTAGGLELGLRRGSESVLWGEVEQGGRVLAVSLCYNRAFEPGMGSWSRSLRPDFSVCFEVKGAPALPPVWLHFDAKYRLEAFPGAEPGEGSAARDDLIKMHAYRDAIRRSAGAYVLYPGSEALAYRSYHELLPGLGAFPLAPLESGPSVGRNTLQRFLTEVTAHLAAQDTQHERMRYWTSKIHSAAREEGRGLPVAPFLRRPPADTPVLLGWVKSAAHAAWVDAKLRYNLRADARRGQVRVGGVELGAELVALYAPSEGRAWLWRARGAVSVCTAEELEAQGYPEPGGRVYFVLELERVEDAGVWSGWLNAEVLEGLAGESGRPVGSPVVVMWERVAYALAEARSGVVGDGGA